MIRLHLHNILEMTKLQIWRQIRGCQRLQMLVGEGVGVTITGLHKGDIYGDRKVLYLDCGGYHKCIHTIKDIQYVVCCTMAIFWFLYCIIVI